MKDRAEQDPYADITEASLSLLQSARKTLETLDEETASKDILDALSKLVKRNIIEINIYNAEKQKLSEITNEAKQVNQEVSLQSGVKIVTLGWWQLHFTRAVVLTKLVHFFANQPIKEADLAHIKTIHSIDQYHIWEATVQYYTKEVETPAHPLETKALAGLCLMIAKSAVYQMQSHVTNADITSWLQNTSYILARVFMRIEDERHFNICINTFVQLTALFIKKLQSDQTLDPSNLSDIQECHQCLTRVVFQKKTSSLLKQQLQELSAKLWAHNILQVTEYEMGPFRKKFFDFDAKVKEIDVTTLRYRARVYLAIADGLWLFMVMNKDGKNIQALDLAIQNIQMINAEADYVDETPWVLIECLFETSKMPALDPGKRAYYGLHALHAIQSIYSFYDIKNHADMLLTLQCQHIDGALKHVESMLVAKTSERAFDDFKMIFSGYTVTLLPAMKANLDFLKKNRGQVCAAGNPDIDAHIYGLMSMILRIKKLNAMTFETRLNTEDADVSLENLEMASLHLDITVSNLQELLLCEAPDFIKAQLMDVMERLKTTILTTHDELVALDDREIDKVSIALTVTRAIVSRVLSYYLVNFKHADAADNSGMPQFMKEYMTLCGEDTWWKVFIATHELAKTLEDEREKLFYHLCAMVVASYVYIPGKSSQPIDLIMDDIKEMMAVMSSLPDEERAAEYKSIFLKCFEVLVKIINKDTTVKLPKKLELRKNLSAFKKIEWKVPEEKPVTELLTEIGSSSSDARKRRTRKVVKAAPATAPVATDAEKHTPSSDENFIPIITKASGLWKPFTPQETKRQRRARAAMIRVVEAEGAKKRSAASMALAAARNTLNVLAKTAVVKALTDAHAKAEAEEKRRIAAAEAAEKRRIARVAAEEKKKKAADEATVNRDQLYVNRVMKTFCGETFDPQVKERIAEAEDPIELSEDEDKAYVNAIIQSLRAQGFFGFFPPKVIYIVARKIGNEIAPPVKVIHPRTNTIYFLSDFHTVCGYKACLKQYEPGSVWQKNAVAHFLDGLTQGRRRRRPATAFRPDRR